MNTNDFLLCTFQGDTETPPTSYVAEITDVNTAAGCFDCRLVDTGQVFTFFYTSGADEAWTGTDANGANYVLDSHHIYTGGNIDPSKEGVAVVTFPDSKRYLGYVESVSPTIDVVFYQSGTPALSIENNTITKSNWDTYPEGTQINSIEGYIESSQETGADTSLTADTSATVDTSGTTASPTSSGSTTFLFVDLYSLDLKGTPNWNALINEPNFYGAILKATQGIKGYSNDGGWFKKNWPILKTIAPARYGSTWFRGAYLFLNLWQDGAAQADHYLNTVTDAGGWDNGDILPIIDVELGNDGANGRPRNQNNDASAQQIIDCTTACADRLRSVTGRNIMLYGRGAMRERSIKSKMGCDVVWNPAYTAHMVMNGLEAWTLDDVVLWQYCGDGDAVLDESKFPRSIPNFGRPDISVYVEGANKPSFDTMKQKLGIGQGVAQPG